MVLSDKDIEIAHQKGEIIVKPLFPNSTQPSSVDLHLGKHFMVFENSKTTCIDPRESVEHLMKKVSLTKKNSFFVLHPGEFALGITYETVGVNAEYCGNFQGLSSLGRLGLAVHITASILNPGNTLNMTLELFNFTNLPLKLYYKMPIAQIQFLKLSSPAKIAYDSVKSNSYVGSKVPVPSQYYKNFLDGKNDWMDFGDDLK